MTEGIRLQLLAWAKEYHVSPLYKVILFNFHIDMRGNRILRLAAYLQL